MHRQEFPDDFLWGAATAAYQIEGATDEDGRAPSIWDTFSHTPGNIANGDTGDVACDHYHRWRDDIDLMRTLGLQTYRFSISWPRVMPQGFGQPNERGLDFYDNVVDGLLAANIIPFVTLYHWDLPQALQDRGGWANRDTVEAFVEYADVVAARLGDRVQHWITHNEPMVTTFLGHYDGVHAPGIKDLRTALQVAHHVLLSHGRAVPVLRSARSNAEVGITLNLSPCLPASEQAADRAAADRLDAAYNRWFLDPLHGRGYPAALAERVGELMPEMQPNDLDIIATPTDFLGINYYFPHYVRAASNDTDPIAAKELTPDELSAAGHDLTAMGWPIVPDAMREMLKHVHREYAPRTIYITENGAAYDDTVTDGAVHDPQRTAYLHRHFNAALESLAAGVPLRGYFVWSLMDNFEWAHGYSKRFGIVHVDYASQQRTLKDSAHWYKRVIEENALVDIS